MTTPVRVKICGITSVADAAQAAAVGADYLGLNFWARSKRVVTLELARELAAAARAARPEVKIVGLFVDAAPIDIATTAVAVGLDVAQLHGIETPETCMAVIARTGLPVWKAIPVSGPADITDLSIWPTAAVLLDAESQGRGGSGQTIDWGLAQKATRQFRVVLAGGLDPGNVWLAIRTVKPWAVDVASGVEHSPGVKDHDKVAAFVTAARGALEVA